MERNNVEWIKKRKIEIRAALRIIMFSSGYVSKLAMETDLAIIQSAGYPHNPIELITDAITQSKHFNMLGEE